MHVTTIGIVKIDKRGHAATATLSPEELTQLSKAARSLASNAGYLSAAAEILRREVSSPCADSAHDMKRFLKGVDCFLDAFSDFSPCWSMIGCDAIELNTSVAPASELPAKQPESASDATTNTLNTGVTADNSVENFNGDLPEDSD